ncbi:engulfment and cell motility protein 1-like isoform X2 [Tubulanus polymorphus]|uniref:engulfment and cell motility protein 1-like isoform X2 n=1 Tax=Tubulanus polymorphus TaxID=672921 RepID=UPI003DA68499
MEITGGDNHCQCWVKPKVLYGFEAETTTVMPHIPENICKVAVLLPGYPTQFIEFDQNKPLAAVLKELCETWMLPDPDDYALRFEGTNKQHYITERNRYEIKNGSVLRHAESPLKMAKGLYERISYGSTEEKLSALKDLASLSADPTFAAEFISKNGLKLVVEMVESGSCAGEYLAFTLKSFVELMDHGTISWDILEPKFIKVLCNAIKDRHGRVATTDFTALQAALDILESVLMQGNGKYDIIEEEVSITNLIQHLQSANQDIQKSSIGLINAMFMMAPQSRKKAMAATLQAKSTLRNIIQNHVVCGGTVGTEMSHQLYALQRHLFNLLEERMMTKVDPNDQFFNKELMELKIFAFDTDDLSSAIHKKSNANVEYFKKLGFRNPVNPSEDLNITPPGILALDNMVYFARTHNESYTKVVLENCRTDEHDCPFAVASIQLTKMLCDILKIGEPPHEEGQVQSLLFFNHDHPFGEFFCTCILTLNKTWKEMRATAEDFPRVLAVVREQITRALETNPGTFDQFKKKLEQLRYAEITNIWQQERQTKEEWESQAKPIVELREQIKPEIIELIKEQRLNYLVNGTMFTKYTSKGNRAKDKYWYCCLSPNHKAFHYGDCDENSRPTLEQLQTKSTLAVVDIREMTIGAGTLKSAKRSFTNLSFSLNPNVDGEPLQFFAPDEETFHMWTDGINALLSKEMTSEKAAQDLETLLGIEVKLRLLDIEGVTIPENPPPIPKEPSNYDFAYQ